MLKLIFFLIVAYVVWKVVGAVIRVMIGSPQRQAPRQKANTPPSRQDKPRFQDIKDADFEDITPPRS